MKSIIIKSLYAITAVVMAFFSSLFFIPAEANNDNNKCLAQYKNGDYCCADCENRKCSSSPDCDSNGLGDE